MCSHSQHTGSEDSSAVGRAPPDRGLRDGKVAARPIPGRKEFVHLLDQIYVPTLISVSVPPPPPVFTAVARQKGATELFVLYWQD